jgi:hypothetical protein
MDDFEQRLVLFLTALRYKAAHKELSTVLGEQADSLSQARRRIRRFKDGDLSYETMIGPGDRSRIFRMEFAGTWTTFHSHRQSTGKTLSDVSTCD